MNRNPSMYSEWTMHMFQRIMQFITESGGSEAGTEHLLWGLATEKNGSAAGVLQRAGVTGDLVKELIRTYQKNKNSDQVSPVLQISADVERVIALAGELRQDPEGKIEPEHLLLGILSEERCAAAKLLVSLGINLVSLKQDLQKDMKVPEASPVTDGKKGTSKQETYQTLEQFSFDLTAAAGEDKTDPMIGREKEVERVVQILSRRTKNNPVLIGEPGVGKTAVAEGLAQRIAAGKIPKNLADKRILSLDLAGMLAGTKFRGEFEERIKTFIEEAKKAGNVILFLDELHTLIGAGASEGSMDAANILKPALSRGELQIIGATTLNEYRKYIEKDTALERRFQQVLIQEPTPEETVQILTGLRERYEDFHELLITKDAVQAAVDLSVRYIADRYLPDKAIDLMDEAASRVRTRGLTVPPHLQELEAEIERTRKQKQDAVRIQAYEDAAKLRDKQAGLKAELEQKQQDWMQNQGRRVTAEDVAAVVSSWTNIPVTMLTEDERTRLLKLEETLHQRIIGQEEAVTAVSRAIRRNRTGIGEPNRPIGTFLFLGPTGVGKTELCRSLAEALFQDEQAMIRMDMSEYMESHTVSKMIGSPPGYIGHDDGGQLTEKVRRNPYSIVLFDEIEKAHPEVWNLLLQIMDDGRLTDSHGRTVSFKNTVIIMTSNIGSRDISGKGSLGFATSDNTADQKLQSRIMDAVKQSFQPEFINRLDEIITFHQLQQPDIHRIARNLLKRLAERTSNQGITLEVSDSAVEVLAKEGFDPSFGARPLRRTIQLKLETTVAEKILDGSVQPGDTLVVSGKDEQLVFEVRSPKKETAAVQS